MIFFGADFFVRKVKGEKGRTRNFKKQFKMKKDYVTHSFQKKKKKKKRTEKETNMTEREKAEDVFSNLLDEKQHVFRYITTGKQKNAKTEETNFSRHRKTRQNKKNKCKTCPTNKGNRQNRVFGDKTEKESLTEVYKDSKNCEERS